MAWWTVAGKTAVAAYDAVGASSLADSYVNEVNPGTNDAAALTAPAWAAGTGWTFTGTQILQTVNPAEATGWTIIARCDTWTTDGSTDFVMGNFSGGSYRLSISGSTASTRWIYGGLTTSAAPSGGGVYCIAGQNAYVNGAFVTAIAAGLGAGNLPMGIGGNNNAASYVGSIQAVAIYSDTLSAAEVAALTTAMNALPTAAGNPVAIIQQQHWRSVWAGGVPVG